MNRTAHLYLGDGTTPPIITFSGLTDEIDPDKVKVVGRQGGQLGTLQGWTALYYPENGTAVLIGPVDGWIFTDDPLDPPDRFHVYPRSRPYMLDPEGSSQDIAEQIGLAGDKLVNEIQAINDAVTAYPLQDTVVDPIAGQIGSIADGIRDAIGAVTAYPLPTTDGQPPAALRTDSGDADSRVASQVAALLGTSANPLDLLNEVDRKLQPQAGPNGRTDYVWTQSAYAGTNSVGAGITGDQATALQFATDAADGLGALADVEPLLPEVSDPEDVRAQLALLTSTWTRYVAALGTEGGPDPVRAPAYFQQANTAINTLGQLYSMLDNKDNPTTAYVFTPEQERQRTIFMTALRRVQAAGVAFKTYLGTEQTDIGRELVLLQDSLDVISVLSQNVASAMDAVRVVDADRQLMSIVSDDPTQQTIGELLDWTSAFARDEAMPQLESSGLRAIPIIAMSLTEMDGSIKLLLGSLAPTSGSNGSTADPYTPLRQDRVRIPVRDLGAAVERAQTQAQGSSIPDAYPPPLFLAVADYIQQAAGNGTKTTTP
jgi:hypothetical protein